jgi:tripartite-type tricarboxylate transporter receptor subunit TctC
MRAQREFELKDGPISALTRVFEALWGRRRRRSPKALLDFKFSLRLPLSVRFKGRWLQSSAVRTRSLALSALLACALIFLRASPANADSIADFYGGRTVTLIVSTSSAGGYDTLARAIARHIGKHIPGNPTVIVRNMPGAGGLTATNYLYAAAERDGSVLGLIQNNPPFEPLFGTPEARFDPRQFNWLGTPSVETAMVLVGKTVPVFTVDDLRTRETVMGASGANSTPAFFARLFNATLGTKMKIIAGYPGQNDALVAMERGELDGYPSVFYSALSSTRPTWLADGTARAIVQYGPAKLPQLNGVPFVPDLVSGADKLLLEAAFAPLSIGRPLLLPPGVPAERVAALRQALAETFADPEFLAEGEKIGLSLNDPRSGEELLRVIERAYAMPAEIVERLRKLNRDQ